MSNTVGSAIIELGVDSQNVEAGFASMDGAIAKTGRNLENLGASAAKGFGDVTTGSGATSATMDRVTRDFENQIQRRIAALQAGSKSNSEYIRSLAEIRGANLPQLEAGLSQLAALEAQQKATTAATQLQSAALAGLGESEAAATARISAMVAASQQEAAAFAGSAQAADINAAAQTRLALATERNTTAGKVWQNNLEGVATVGRSTDAIDQNAVAQTRLASASDRAAAANRGWQQNMAGVTASMNATAASSDALSAGAQKIIDRYDPLGTKLRALQADLALVRKELGDSVSPAAIKTFQGLEAEIDKTTKLMATANADGFEPASKGLLNISFASAGATRELLVLGREAISGNTAKLPGSFLLLAQRIGATDALLNPLTLGLAGAGAAAAALISIASEGHNDFVGLNNALASTNNYAGQTRLSMDELAESVSKAGTLTIGTSKQIVTALVASGQIGGKALSDVAGLAENYARVTGQDIDTVAPKLVQLFSDPVAGANELNKSMHFLTQTDIDHIATLVRLGDVQGAQAELARKTAAALPDQAKNVSGLTSAYDLLAKAVSSAYDEMKKRLAGDTDQYSQAVKDLQNNIDQLRTSGVDDDQIAKAQKALDDYKANAKAASAASTAAAQKASEDRSKTDAQQQSINKSQLVHIQQLKDEYALVAGAPDSAGKAARELEIQKQIDDAYRALGADARAATTEQINQQEALSAIRLKGAADQASADLALGNLNKVQYDQAVTQNQLQQNLAKQLQEQRLAGVAGLTDAERQAHLDKVAQLKQEADLITKSGANTVAVDQKKSYDDMFSAIETASDAAIKSIDDQNKQEQQRGLEIGKTKAQVDALRAAQAQQSIEDLQAKVVAIDAQIKLEDLQGDALKIAEANIATINREIVARQGLANTLASNAVTQANSDAAAKASAAWDLTAKHVEDALADAIANGGDKAWKKLKTSIVSQVLSIPINFVGSLAASFLNPTAAQASTGAGASGSGEVGSLIGAANTASSAYKLATGGVSASIGGGIAAAGNAIGSSSLSAFGAGFAGTSGPEIGMTAAETFEAAGMTAEASAASFGAAVSAALPWVAGAALGIKLLSGLFDSGPESDTRLTFASNNQAGNISINERGNEGQTTNPYIGGYGTSSLGTFGVSSSFWTDTNSAAVQALIKNVATTDDALASYLTADEKTAVTTALSNHTDTVHTGAEGSDQNASGQLDSVFTDRINTILEAVEPGLGKLEAGFTGTSQELATEATALLAYRNSLKDSGQAIFGAQVTLEQIAALKTPTEATSAALTRVTDEFNATNAVAAAVGKDASTAFGAVGLASEAARAQLITLAGGVSTLTTETASYSQNYLTSAEQLAPTLKAVTAAMDAMGLSGVTTRDQFKAVVDSLDLSTTAGATEYAQLMALSDAFAQVHDATVDATKSEADIASERADLQDQLNKLTLTSTQLTELQRAAIDDSNKALFDQVQAAQAAKDAADDQSKILDQQSQLYAATGDAAGAAAVLEQQHEAALVGLSPALAAATQATWDAQAAEKAKSDALSISNSLLDIQAQIYQVTGNAAGAAAVLEQQHIAALDAMDPALRGATEQLYAVQAAAASQQAAADALNGFAKGIQATVDAANTAIDAFQKFKDSLYVGDQSPLSKQDQYTVAKAQFQAAGPDDLQAAATTFLTAAKATDSVIQYAKDFAAVQAALDAAISGKQSTVANAGSVAQSLAQALASAGIGAHANGGIASGLSLVGEQGPELVDFRQSARVYTASQTSGILSGTGNNQALLDRIDTLISKTDQLHAESKKATAHARNTSEILRRVTKDGNSLITTVAS